VSIIDRDDAIYGLLMRLRQVGRLQIGRILGTISHTRGSYKAWIDLLERSYFLRAEVNALTKVLFDKGLLDRASWQKYLEEELRQYLGDLAQQWPEVELQDTGFTIKDTAAFAERCAREGWPP
jgi:hypothetical protein